MAATATATAAAPPTGDPVRERAVAEYRRKVGEHRDIEGRLKESK